MFIALSLRTLFVVALVLALGGAAHAQTSSTDPAIEKKIREVLVLTGSADMASAVMSQMLPAMKEMAPGVPESVWKDLEKEMDAEELVQLIVPIYAAQFTEAELDAMIAFYGTPEGKSIIKKMPQVMVQSMTVGQQWGQKAAERVFQKLQEKGYAPKS
jgi:hypothetical protein